jgi:hypothetical protein
MVEKPASNFIQLLERGVIVHHSPEFIVPPAALSHTEPVTVQVEPTAVEIKEALRINPMRMLNRFECGACGYYWQQPASSGTCPKCHVPDAKLYQSIPCMLPRA